MGSASNIQSRSRHRNGGGTWHPSTRQFIFALAICLSLTMLAGVSVLSDESSAALCDNVTVYVENPDGGYDKTTVNGASTVQGAIESALSKLNMTWEYGSENRFLSVNGRTLDDDHYWRIHQWLPLGTAGWGIMGYDSKSDSFMQTGCSYCLHVCTISSVDGTNVYSSPNFKPESTGYVFIRFANGFDPDNISVQETFTSEVRAEGFWLSGKGSSMGEVLKDAVESQGLDVELKTGIDGNGNDLQCWITSMFGLGDVYMDNGTWAYWSQWTWVNHEWYYNDWTLGYYDPAVYKYVECIYLISTPDPYGSGYVVDKGGREPNPDVDTITCISNYNTVVFKSGNKTVSTQEVRYGHQADTSKVPEPKAPEGEVFLGWGDVTKPITGYTVFTAQFGKSVQYTVRYYDESKTVLLNTEKVTSGEAAKYDGTPSKPETSEYTFTFKGWSSDLSCVTSDIDVTPVFEAVKKSGGGGSDPQPQHTHSWDSGTVTKEPTCTSAGEKTFRCSCGETKKEIIPAKGHQWSDWTVKEKADCHRTGTETRTCSACGEVETRSTPMTKHQWSDWVIEKQATPESDGVKCRTCSNCGDVQRSSFIYKGFEPIDIKGDSSTTTVTPQGDAWSAESKLASDVEVKGDTATVSISPDAVIQAVEQLASADDGASEMSVTISVKADSGDAKVSRLEISSEDIRKLSEVGGYTLRYETTSFRIDVGSGILETMGGEGVSLSFSDNVSVPSATMSGIIGGHAIDITMTSDDSNIHKLGGIATVSVPFELPDGMDARDVSVWYIDGSTPREIESAYDADTGTASFDTDHFSQWIIGFKDGSADNPSEGSDGGDNTILFIAAGIVTAVAIAAIALFVIRKRSDERVHREASLRHRHRHNGGSLGAIHRFHGGRQGREAGRDARLRLLQRGVDPVPVRRGHERLRCPHQGVLGEGLRCRVRRRRFSVLRQQRPLSAERQLGDVHPLGRGEKRSLD